MKTIVTITGIIKGAPYNKRELENLRIFFDKCGLGEIKIQQETKDD
jgi:hypothetical protein